MNQELCLFLLKGTAFYFISINIAYGILLLLSWMKIKRYHFRLGSVQKPRPIPGISFIIPAFNEESLIVETIQTYLSLSAIQKEIIVINDGSHDQTFKLLQTMYQLQKVEGVQDRTFRSITNPDLFVMEVPHSGKAQALNFGVRHATHDLVCTMDADTVPDAKGVEAMLQAFAHDAKLIAAGGVIQVLDTKNLKNNSPVAFNSHGWLTTFQRIEYLRTFICERMGWSFLGSTILISGAFCMIKKDAINRVGGFRPESITEDFDLILRLRREYNGEKHHFQILPITTCFTQVPSTCLHLKKQRMRWQLGLVQTLSRHLSLFLHPGYGPLGLFAIPYFWIVEVFSPIVEGLALVIIPYALYQQWIPLDLVLIYLGIGLAFNVGITLMGVYFDNEYISRTKSWSYLKTTINSILLHFGYQQINSWWRFLALLKSFRKESSWGDKPRVEIIHQKT